MVTSVTMSARELETLQCAALDRAATSMQIAKEKCAELRDASTREDSLVGDTRVAIRLAREALDALDALGWPEEDTRDDRTGV